MTPVPPKNLQPTPSKDQRQEIVIQSQVSLDAHPHHDSLGARKNDVLGFMDHFSHFSHHIFIKPSIAHSYKRVTLSRHNLTLSDVPSTLISASHFTLREVYRALYILCCFISYIPIRSLRRVLHKVCTRHTTLSQHQLHLFLLTSLDTSSFTTSHFVHYLNLSN